MRWDAEQASRTVWAGLDKSATNGEVRLYIRDSLQDAYDAGVRDALLQVKLTEQAKRSNDEIDRLEILFAEN